MTISLPHPTCRIAHWINTLSSAWFTYCSLFTLRIALLTVNVNVKSFTTNDGISCKGFLFRVFYWRSIVFWLVELSTHSLTVVSPRINSKHRVLLGLAADMRYHRALQTRWSFTCRPTLQLVTIPRRKSTDSPINIDDVACLLRDWSNVVLNCAFVIIIGQQKKVVVTACIMLLAIEASQRTLPLSFLECGATY